jgi:hypothetical protein
MLSFLQYKPGKIIATGASTETEKGQVRYEVEYETTIVPSRYKLRLLLGRLRIG